MVEECLVCKDRAKFSWKGNAHPRATQATYIESLHEVGHTQQVVITVLQNSDHSSRQRNTFSFSGCHQTGWFPGRHYSIFPKLSPSLHINAVKCLSPPLCLPQYAGRGKFSKSIKLIALLPHWETHETRCDLGNYPTPLLRVPTLLGSPSATHGLHMVSVSFSQHPPETPLISVASMSLWPDKLCWQTDHGCLGLTLI